MTKAEHLVLSVHAGNAQVAPLFQLDKDGVAVRESLAPADRQALSVEGVPAVPALRQAANVAGVAAL
jgi:hypothetical protein